MAKYGTIYQTIGPELEEIARLNKGQIPRATFERLVSENFGCNDRTIRSYTATFKTFGILRQLNKSWYQFKPWIPTGECDESEQAAHQVVKC
jgi:hypothetical protein